MNIKFMEGLEKNNIHKARKFNCTFWYIDDLISLYNDDIHKDMSDIYPKELCVKQENTSPTNASYLDLQIDIENQQFHTKLYDKCDSFNFSIINFPFVEESNIPENPAYGVYSSRLISIARACDSFADFKDCHNCTLMRQGFQYKRLSKQLKKTLGKHKELFSMYQSSIEVPLPINASNIWHVTIHS